MIPTIIDGCLLRVQIRQSASSSLLIGVSQNKQPIRLLESIPHRRRTPRILYGADYPSIGFNMNWIVVQNEYVCSQQ